MSCGNPVVEGDSLMTPRLKFDRSKDCVKCRVNQGNIVIRHAVYCRDCFLPFVAWKFRRALEPLVNAEANGPRRAALKASGNLLIGFSGGLGSTVLLDLVSQCYFTDRTSSKGGKEHPRHARVWPKAAVCYVEVCNAFPGMRDRTDEVQAIVNKYDAFEFIPLRIEDAFDASWWEKVGGSTIDYDLGADLANEDLTLSSLPSESVSSPINALHSYIKSLPTQTAIPSTIQTLKRLLLLHTGQSTETSHLLLGTSLTSLSISLISSISQGGGFVVQEEAQEEWTPTKTSQSNGHRKRKIRVVRPLKDVGMKESAVWAWWSGLKVIGREKLPGSRQGIGALTKDFIVGLERDYPSTVSTIARTCGKLASKHGSVGICILCERPAQCGVQDWKNRISIRSLTEQSQTALHASLTPYLCYACHTTLTSRSSRGTTPNSNLDSTSPTSTPLPVWVKSRLQDCLHNGTTVEALSDVENAAEEEEELWQTRRMEISDMKNAVADFLLE